MIDTSLALDPRRPADLVIEGGLVVAPGWQGPATVEVRDGRIIALHEPGNRPMIGSGTRVLDARGTWVLPGGVDPHVHLHLRLGSTATRDSGLELAEAALLGGTTSLLIHALPKRGEDTPSEAVDRIKSDMQMSLAAFGVHACIPGWVDDFEGELDLCWERGTRTVKLFTTYREELMVDSDQLVRLLAEIQLRGGRALIHAEDNALVTWATEHGTDGRVSTFMSSRPQAAEVAAVDQVLGAARLTGASVYFVHLSTPEAIQLVTAARSDGVDASCETCPHYLLLDDSLYSQGSGELYLCCPPLRDERTVEALQRELAGGRIDAVGSDHCCYTQEQKALGRERASEGPMGLPGIQLRNALVLDRFVTTGSISLGDASELLCAGPARMAGIYPRKGCVAVGSDADLVLWESGSPWLVDSQALAIASNYSPFEGAQLSVRPRAVVRAGWVVAEDGALVDDDQLASARGEFLVGDPTPWR